MLPLVRSGYYKNFHSQHKLLMTHQWCLLDQLFEFVEQYQHLGFSGVVTREYQPFGGRAPFHKTERFCEKDFYVDLHHPKIGIHIRAVRQAFNLASLYGQSCLKTFEGLNVTNVLTDAKQSFDTGLTELIRVICEIEPAKLAQVGIYNMQTFEETFQLIWCYT